MSKRYPFAQANAYEALAQNDRERGMDVEQILENISEQFGPTHPYTLAYARGARA